MRQTLLIGLALLLAAACAQPAANPRQRLQQARDVSRELAARDEEASDKNIAMAPEESFPRPAPDELVKRFPRQSHVARYAAARPWSWAHVATHRRHLAPADVPRWPAAEDAPALRELLEDKDSALRGLAAEALATLHQPEDVPKLARLLGDAADAAPLLGFNLSLSARAMVPRPEKDADPLEHARSWRKEKVGQVAWRSLTLMTGKSFANEAEFQAWWKINHDARNCLWYWQQRLDREREEVDIATHPEGNPMLPGETWEQRQVRCRALNEAAWARAHQAIAAELRERAPEVEAKVRLLTFSRHVGGAPITGSEAQFWPEAPKLRLTPERLLDLLDGKDLWPDVSWTDNGDRNLLAERLGLWAHVLFRPADVPRLRAVLQRNQELAWSGRAALIIGISRLLPPAAAAPAGKLDDPETRDGCLRRAIGQEGELFTRTYCARELVRIGLPGNADFLTDIAFHEKPGDQDNQMMQGILQALAARPHTPETRRLLVALLLDKRFEIYWTRPNSRMGMDMCRHYGVWAINAHAGREVIDLYSIRDRLVDPAKSAQSMAELRALLAQLGQGPTTRPGASNP